MVSSLVVVASSIISTKPLQGRAIPAGLEVEKSVADPSIRHDEILRKGFTLASPRVPAKSSTKTVIKGQSPNWRDVGVIKVGVISESLNPVSRQEIRTGASVVKRNEAFFYNETPLLPRH
jgi:hypothetical protein